MKLDNAPTFEEWRSLHLIASHVDLIVNDGVYTPPTQDFLGGLLFARNDSPPPKADDPISELRALLLTRTTLLGQGVERELIRYLPGIENLGRSRPERLQLLTTRLADMKAYYWLSEQESFRDVRRSLERLSKSGPYARDDVLFLMLRALVPPLQVFLFHKEHQIAPAYPSKEEVTDALRHARALAYFLKNRNPVYGAFNIPHNLHNALETFANELSAKKAAYRKPKDDGALHERNFRDQLVQALFNEFGSVSLSLLRNLLAMIDYMPGERELARQVSALQGPLKQKHRQALAAALRTHGEGGV